MTATSRDPQLPRLRTDLSDAVRAVPAPAVPTLADPFAVRVADPATDAQLVAEWMARPHLVATWEQDWPADRWRRNMAARLAGRYSVPCVIGYCGRDVGYLEIYRVAQDEVGAFYDSAPTDLGIHIAIGEQELLGRGIFSRFLHALTDAMADAEPDCDIVIGDPDHRNAPIRRALAKAGFTEAGIVAVRPQRTIALMSRGRTPIVKEVVP